MDHKGQGARLTPRLRRWLPFLIAISALLLVGFYSVTNRDRLEHDYLLSGADWVGYAVCHRITSRSFAINGRQLPLCARCSGMYLGVMLTAVVLWLSGRLRWSALPPLRIIVILVGFVGVMGVDGINSYLHFFPNAPHFYQPRNWLRLTTGMGTGLAMGLFIFPALAQTLWRYQDYRPVVKNLRELGGLLLLATVTVLLLLSDQGAILYVMALVSAAGVLVVLAAILTIFLLFLLRREGQAISWPETLLPLSIGLLFAVLGISIVSYVRYSVTGTMSGLPGL